MRREDQETYDRKMYDLESKIIQIGRDLENGNVSDVWRDVYLEELDRIEEELDNLLIELGVENFLDSVDKLLEDEGYLNNENK